MFEAWLSESSPPALLQASFGIRETLERKLLRLQDGRTLAPKDQVRGFRGRQEYGERMKCGLVGTYVHRFIGLKLGCRGFKTQGTSLRLET